MPSCIIIQLVVCLLRVDDNCITCPASRPLGTLARLREVEACLGNVRGCDSFSAGG